MMHTIQKSGSPATHRSRYLTLFMFAVFCLFSLVAKADGVDTLSTDEDGNKYVCMPTTGTNTLKVDETVKKISIYGDKYKDYYSFNSHGYLQIIAPEGYRIELTGSMRVTTYDSLSVYDGLSTNDSLLIDKKTAPEDNGELFSIGTVASSANNMMLYFHTGEYDKYQGGCS